LTAISLPARESGRRAAELLLDVIEGHPTAAEQPLIPIDLIIRGSAAPPRTAH
jgi:DNA-binding LacI/PurR family transcriptional regulator